MVISDPAVLKVLADPVRLRVLGAFVEPSTALAAARRLGMGRGIYRHVDALVDAGLLVVVSTQRKRGTIERTLQSTARRYVGELGSLGGATTGLESGLTTHGTPHSTKVFRATACLRDEDWPDFEAAFADLVREFDVGEGCHYELNLLASVVDE
jgi:hypothetical protein